MSYEVLSFSLKDYDRGFLCTKLEPTMSKLVESGALASWFFDAEPLQPVRYTVGLLAAKTGADPWAEVESALRPPVTEAGGAIQPRTPPPLGYLSDRMGGPDGLENFLRFQQTDTWLVLELLKNDVSGVKAGLATIFFITDCFGLTHKQRQNWASNWLVGWSKLWPNPVEWLERQTQAAHQVLRAKPELAAAMKELAAGGRLGLERVLEPFAPAYTALGAEARSLQRLFPETKPFEFRTYYCYVHPHLHRLGFTVEAEASLTALVAHAD